MMKRILLSASMLLIALTIFGQQAVKGYVVDSSTQEPLIGVSVTEENSTNGALTGLDGSYSIVMNKTSNRLVITYIGYETQTVASADAAKILLVQELVNLNDVVVSSSIAIQRKTPVAVSQIDAGTIELKLGNMEFPEILKSTPGVYATRDGGGFGDSKINMRGFQAANVAVMINGVPVNDMENGRVYWSNWAGMADVTRAMQTQRGLGASKVSAPSVGGSINIITKALDSKAGGSVEYSVGNDGYNKMLFSASTGLINGWAMTVLGGYTRGDGYIQGTDFKGWNYYLSVSKVFNPEHTLSFTIFGAPQQHYQRSSYDGLTIEGWQQVKNYMNGESTYRYNPTYGFGRNGERKTSNFNEYHKPQMSLNYNWQITPTSNLSTVAYASLGRGSGYSGQGSTAAYSGYWYGANNGALSTMFRNGDGTFAYDKIYDLNEASTSGSQMIMSKSINSHNWYGLISTYSAKLPKNIDFYAGVDLRYYKGVHTNEIIDLYGGNYYIDRYRSSVKAAYNSAAAASDFASKKLQVGDVVYRDYDGYTMQEGAFAQAEGNFDKLNVFVAGSLSNTSYWRYDRFYYDAEHARSKTLNSIGYTVKGGANYNIDNHHNVFANIGYISRAPFYSGGAFLQSTTSNELNPDAVNEKIFSAEIGYGFRSKYLTANLNLYHTRWMDKALNRSADFSYVENGVVVDDRYIINMQGVDAVHQGVELELRSAPAKWLELTGMLSIGDWRWNSNATGYFYNSGGQPLADAAGTIASGIMAPDHAHMTLNLKGIRVAGSAQSTWALGASFKPMKGLRIGIDVNGFSRNFADWSFSSNDLVMNGTKNFNQSWQIPGAALVDLNASYGFPIGKMNATISGTVQNLFNQLYIADAYDGGNNDWASAYRVFYGFGRTWTCRLKVNF